MYRFNTGRGGALARTLLAAAFAASASRALAQQPAGRNSIMYKVETATERLEMVVNTSRILTLEEKIPRAQVNNPDVISVTPLSPNQVQISAKKPGVTEINLWTDKDEIRSLDVIVYGDARELEAIIKTQYPSASIKVYPTANSVVLKGFVDRSDHVGQIIRIAEDYYPKVIPNITVGGVQQILLHVKVMEVSRTKLRAVGFDFSNLNGNDFVVSSVSGLISAAANGAAPAGTGNDTVRFGVVDGHNAFFGFLEALRRNDMMKVLAEPNIVAVSGRPAFFNVGGEIPILVPESLGTVSIDYKKYGTQIDFVPVVLGNGNIRLEVRPRISEIDDTRSVVISGISVPALRTREVDTGVEMKAGQTFALAGLIQERVEATNVGIPYLADLPYFGVPFRRVRETKNEIELVILVRPELVEPMDCQDVPRVGPGLQTTSPNDCELYFKGYMEVPTCNGPAPTNGMRMPEELPPAKSGNGAAAPAASGKAALNSPSSSRRSESTSSSSAAARPTAVTPGRSANSDTASRNNPTKPSEVRRASATESGPSFVGPLGYDVNN